MTIPIPNDFYEKAIEKFESRSADPIAFPALIVLLNDAEQSSNKLAVAYSIINNDEKLSAYLEIIRLDPPRDYSSLLERIERRICQKFEGEQSKALMEKIANISDGIEAVGSKVVAVGQKVDSSDQKGEARGQSIGELQKKLSLVQAEASQQAQEHNKQSRLQRIQIIGLKRTIKKQQKQHDAERDLDKEERKTEKEIADWRYKIGTWLAVIGTALSILGIGLTIRDDAKQSPQNDGAKDKIQNKIDTEAHDASSQPKSDKVANTQTKPAKNVSAKQIKDGPDKNSQSADVHLQPPLSMQVLAERSTAAKFDPTKPPSIGELIPLKKTPYGLYSPTGEPIYDLFQANRVAVQGKDGKLTFFCTRPSDDAPIEGTQNRVQLTPR